MHLIEHERKLKEEERKRDKRTKFENEEEKSLTRLFWIVFPYLER